MKNLFLPSFIFVIVLFTGCGDAESDSVLFGKWLATDDLSRVECDNEFSNGRVNCGNDVGFGNTRSCIELTFNQSGEYHLNIKDIESNPTNEFGTYSTSSANIRLSPASPVGAPYDLPIIESDYENLTVRLPRDFGCVLLIPMIKTAN
ncbi:MAG: hypothetical protein JXR07_08220 [Reichenbachiella sp.]